MICAPASRVIACRGALCVWGYSSQKFPLLYLLEAAQSSPSSSLVLLLPSEESTEVAGFIMYASGMYVHIFVRGAM